MEVVGGGSKRCHHTWLLLLLELSESALPNLASIYIMIPMICHTVTGHTMQLDL